MLVPGAQGQKSVFPDGIQVDHLSENTVGHGTRVKGVSDPTTYPVIAGDVGEIALGSAALRSGTGGFTYSVLSTTVATNTDSALVAITLNKGVYLVSLRGKCYRSDSANFTELSGTARVGGTTVTNILMSATNNTASATISFVLPVVITADGTTVDLFGKIGAGTSLGNTYEINAVRIA
jgi:hypothetical protein